MRRYWGMAAISSARSSTRRARFISQTLNSHLPVNTVTAGPVK